MSPRPPLRTTIRPLELGPCPVSLEVGRRLSCRRLGSPEAPVLLFLHGITGSHHYWAPARERFGGTYQLVLPDLMGFGSSPKPPVAYDPRAHVSAIRGCLEAQGLADRPLRIVAHSLGALIALEYMLHWPGQVESAVLIGLPCYADRREAHDHFLAGSPNYRRLVGQHSWRANLRSWWQAGPTMSLRYLFAFSPRIAADSKSWTLRSLTSTIEHCLLEHRVQRTLEALAKLPAGQQPRLRLIHGERDQVTPIQRVRELEARLPDTELRVLGATGHHPFRTHPRAVLDHIESFLGQGIP